MGTITVNNSYAAIFGGDYYTGKQINNGQVDVNNYALTNYLELLPFEIKDGDLGRKNIIYFYSSASWASICWAEEDELPIIGTNKVTFEYYDGTNRKEYVLVDIKDVTTLLNTVVNGHSLIDDIKTNRQLTIEKRDGISDALFERILNSFRLNYRD